MNEATPKKSLGQHWLTDADILQKICNLAEIQPGELVIEIGPGLGTLTDKLLQAGADVTAVEFDDVLAKNLPEKFNTSNLKVINQDILKFNFSEVTASYKIVANIPYYLTSNLIRVISESVNPPSKVVLLIQKEVAERLCAGAGNMSLLSVWAQMYFDCRLGPLVEAKYFSPPPKVDSQVVILERLEVPKNSKADQSVLKKLISAGFSNKRKTLHNSLSAGLQLPKETVGELLKMSDLSLSSRPQELSIDNWLALAQNLPRSELNT